jgi:hypothetical protein
LNPRERAVGCLYSPARDDWIDEKKVNRINAVEHWHPFCFSRADSAIPVRGGPLKKSTLSVAAVAATLVLSATSAFADVVIIDLNQNNLGIPGSVGTVTVSLVNSTTATITFQAATGYRFIDGGALAINIPSTANYAFSNLSPATLSFGGSGNEDGMGSFTDTWNLPNASPANSQATMSLTVTDVGGAWASAANVLALNTPGANGGGYAAAHIGVCDIPSCGTGFQFGNTGYGAGNTQRFPSSSSVLEPNSASLALVALGLLGVGFWSRRKV